MISEKRLEELQSNLLTIFGRMENDLLENIGDKIDINENITQENVRDWQTSKLLELRELNNTNVSTINKYSDQINTELEKTFTRIGYESVADDETIFARAVKKGLIDEIDTTVRNSSSLANIIQASIAQAKDKANLTNTIALENTNKRFLDIVNQGFLEVNTGIRDYKSSIRSAVKKLADEGITAQTYRTSRGIMTYNIEAAVRREILTTTVQTAGKMQLARMEEYGQNLVEVTSHVGSRPDHAEWQGKIYSVKGTQAQYRNLAEVTKYGTVTGLQGANCKHQFFPYIPGISIKRHQPVSKRENKKVYRESQRQRYLERQIKNEKRRIILLDKVGDKEGLQQASVKLLKKEADLTIFKKETKRVQANRVEVVGFTRSLSQIARKTAKEVKQ